MSAIQQEHYEHITIDCAGCGAKNELTFSTSSNHQKVSCSHCGATLGRLSDFLVVPAKPQDHRSVR